MGNPGAFEWVAGVFRGDSKKINLLNSVGSPITEAVRTETVKPHAALDSGARLGIQRRMDQGDPLSSRGCVSRLLIFC